MLGGHGDIVKRKRRLEILDCHEESVLFAIGEVGRRLHLRGPSLVFHRPGPFIFVGAVRVAHLDEPSYFAGIAFDLNRGEDRVRMPLTQSKR